VTFQWESAMLTQCRWQSVYLSERDRHALVWSARSERGAIQRPQSPIDSTRFFSLRSLSLLFGVRPCSLRPHDSAFTGHAGPAPDTRFGSDGDAAVGRQVSYGLHRKGLITASEQDGSDEASYDPMRQFAELAGDVRDPYPMFAGIRAETPVLHVELGGGPGG